MTPRFSKKDEDVVLQIFGVRLRQQLFREPRATALHLDRVVLRRELDEELKAGQPLGALVLHPDDDEARGKRRPRRDLGRD
jgi:hypothetical protein